MVAQEAQTLSEKVEKAAWWWQGGGDEPVELHPLHGMSLSDAQHSRMAHLLQDMTGGVCSLPAVSATPDLTFDASLQLLQLTLKAGPTTTTTPSSSSPRSAFASAVASAVAITSSSNPTASTASTAGTTADTVGVPASFAAAPQWPPGLGLHLQWEVHGLSLKGRRDHRGLELGAEVRHCRLMDETAHSQFFQVLTQRLAAATPVATAPSPAAAAAAARTAAAETGAGVETGTTARALVRGRTRGGHRRQTAGGDPLLAVRQPLVIVSARSEARMGEGLKPWRVPLVGSGSQDCGLEPTAAVPHRGHHALP